MSALSSDQNTKTKATGLKPRPRSSTTSSMTSASRISVPWCFFQMIEVWHWFASWGFKMVEMWCWSLGAWQVFLCCLGWSIWARRRRLLVGGALKKEGEGKNNLSGCGKSYCKEKTIQVSSSIIGSLPFSISLGPYDENEHIFLVNHMKILPWRNYAYQWRIWNVRVVYHNSPHIRPSQLRQLS